MKSMMSGSMLLAVLVSGNVSATQVESATEKQIKTPTTLLQETKATNESLKLALDNAVMNDIKISIQKELQRSLMTVNFDIERNELSVPSKFANQKSLAKSSANATEDE